MAATSSAAISYLPVRSLSGLFSANGVVTDTGRRKISWKPDKTSDWVYDPATGKGMKPSVELVKSYDYVLEHILGGSNNKTLPQVESLMTRGQAETLFFSLFAAAQQQQVNNNAQAIAAMREILVNTAVPGATQIPAVQLQPAEVVPPSPVLPESPGGGD